MTRTPIIATVVIAGAALLYWGYGVTEATRKLSSLEPLPARAHYALTLSFPPERFHQLRLQDQGRVVEVRNRTVFMMDVGEQSIRDVARAYWVDRVAPWAGR